MHKKIETQQCRITCPQNTLPQVHGSLKPESKPFNPKVYDFNYKATQPNGVCSAEFQSVTLNAFDHGESNII